MPQLLFSLNHIKERHYPILAGILKTCLKASDCIALHGDIGAGKTSFARSFIQSYLDNQNMEVPSPTFTLAQHYPSQKQDKPDIWHYDFYRLKDENEIFEIGFEENLNGSINIVEWPEKIANHLPKNTLFIQFKSCSAGNSRQLNFISNQGWNILLEQINNNPDLSKLIENENNSS